MAAQHDHGHTPAAWTGVIIAFVGFCVAGGFMIADSAAGFWAGMALILLAPVVGGVMKLMGMGSDQRPLAHSPAPAGSQEERASADV